MVDKVILGWTQGKPMFNGRSTNINSDTFFGVKKLFVCFV